MRVSDIYIAGIGSADVDHLSTAEAVENGWYTAEARDRSGLISVTVAGSRPAPDLAIDAARKAIDESRHAAEEIGAVFHTGVHPQGPDGWSAQHYINRNTVNQPVTSVEIRNGCVGFFSSLQLGASLLQSCEARPAVLITAADNFGTPSVNRWRAAPRMFVLADGGGALVLSRHHGFARLLAVGSVSDPELEDRHRSGEVLFPPGPTAGGTLNFEERLDHWAKSDSAADGPQRMTDYGALVIAAVENTLKEADTSIDDISRVVHDGYALDALHAMFLEPLGIEQERSIWEFTREVGHAGPVDQVRGLEYVWRCGRLHIGEKVLMVSDAPGMEAACAVFEIVAEPASSENEE